MTPALATRLLASIEQDKLVLFCGAGLSMAAPSAVPSAAELARDCANKYLTHSYRTPLPAGAQDDLEKLADFFYGQGLAGLFIRDLVNWKPFRRSPNKGHSAVADFAACGAVKFVATTNLDWLIEMAALQLGEANFEAALDGQQMNTPRPHRPLLKLHGCCVRDVDSTLWCRRQLRNSRSLGAAQQTARSRVYSSVRWLAGCLAERDLVFLGFWSDWKYLNYLLAAALRSVHGTTVVLVDPASPEQLSQKAPKLWRWAKTNNFHHERVSADQFLDDLRIAYSQNFLERVLRDSMSSFQASRPGVPVPEIKFDHIAAEGLLALRRDCCGVRTDDVPRARLPDDGMNAVGRAHLFLRSTGAGLDGATYMTPSGKRVRVINGRTRLLNQVKAGHLDEPPRVPSEDIVICAGADDDGNVPPDVVRKRPASETLVRRGDSARWVTLATAQTEGLC